MMIDSLFDVCVKMCFTSYCTTCWIM